MFKKIKRKEKEFLEIPPAEILVHRNNDLVQGCL